jgi:hypothetical protein
MIAARPHPAAAAEHAIDGPSESDGEAADTRSESMLIVCLGEEMDVVGLNRVFDDAEPGARSPGESTPERGEDAGGAEAADGVFRPERYVDGMCGDMRWPGAVRYAWAMG